MRFLKPLMAAALLGAGAAAAQEAAQEPAAPAASEPRTILFGFDRAPFGAEGIETVSSVARRFRLDGAAAVDVTAFTDTAGDAQINLALSQRRLAFVRDELMARGVPAAAIAGGAFGEARLAEETGDGVRRQANRRAQIALVARGAVPPPDESRPAPMRLPPAPALSD